MSAGTISFPEATRGHVVSVFTPPKYQWQLRCSCGWTQNRPKVARARGREVKHVIMPKDEWRGLADIHLHGVWRDAQQGRLA